jgi:hypothetical protein
LQFEVLAELAHLDLIPAMIDWIVHFGGEITHDPLILLREPKNFSVRYRHKENIMPAKAAITMPDIVPDKAK